MISAGNLPLPNFCPKFCCNVPKVWHKNPKINKNYSTEHRETTFIHVPGHSVTMSYKGPQTILSSELLKFYFQKLCLKYYP